MMSITGTRSGAVLGAKVDHLSVELAQQLLGCERRFTTAAMSFGIQNEASALSLYETGHTVSLTRGAFFRHPAYPYLACSPDGFDDTHLVEVKCVAPKQGVFGPSSVISASISCW